MIEASDFVVKSLGTCRVDSPMLSLLNQRKQSINNVDETDRVLFDDIASIAIERNLPTVDLPGFAGDVGVLTPSLTISAGFFTSPPTQWQSRASCQKARFLPACLAA